MKPINIQVLMGHSTGISDSYYRATTSELVEDYLKAIDYLTISNEHRLQMQVTELIEKTKNSYDTIKSALQEKEEEIQILRQRDSTNTDAIASLSDQLMKVMQEIEELKKQR
jgi:fibronectin type 3 domain-containing protein